MWTPDNASSVAVRPTPGAAGTAQWANASTELQHDVFNAIYGELRDLVETVGGIALDKTDVNQLTPILFSTRAAVADDADTGVATTPSLRGIFASAGSQASGASSACVASGTCTASGATSGTLGSSNSTASGTNNSAAVASTGATVSGTQAAAIAAENTTVARTNSAVIASVDSDIAVVGERCAALATDDCSPQGTDCAAVASADAQPAGNQSAALACAESSTTGTTSATIGSGATGLPVRASGTRSVLVGSVACELNTASALALGWAAAPVGVWPGADTNLTVRLEATTGNGYFDGVADVGAADYAEYFEADGGPHAVGALLTRVGTKVRLADAGDRIIGVVAARPGVVGNGASLGWAGRYVLDEWGRPIWDSIPWVTWPKARAADGSVERAGYYGPVDRAPEPIPADAVRSVQRARRTHPDYEPGRPYKPRHVRPDEWTCVSLLGQVRVRVDATVEDGGDVFAGAGGVGTSDQSKVAGVGAQLECMQILSPFDPGRGFGIALCFIR